MCDALGHDDGRAEQRDQVHERIKQDDTWSARHPKRHPDRTRDPYHQTRGHRPAVNVVVSWPAHHGNFGGSCEKAFRYYEEHLGGSITMIMRAKDLPPDAPAPPGSPDAVIHARMSIAGVELIGNDVPAARFEPMRSAYLYLGVDSPEAA